MRLHIKVIDEMKRQNSKNATCFFNCLILLLFTCQFQQIHTGNVLVPARHHCRNALRLDPVMLENKVASDLEQLPPPRLLNSHLPFDK